MNAALVVLHLSVSVSVCLSPSSHHNHFFSSLASPEGAPESPHNSMKVTPVVIERSSKGFGFILKPIRVYIGDSNNYRIHHIVQVQTNIRTLLAQHMLHNEMYLFLFLDLVGGEERSSLEGRIES